ncbi:NUDIX domain-containing protein [Aurantiacibacter aquimixticola]|uniref:8-oxo-dGTP diphosphatase n=1 Tax=Aurantiacibacter aquimixticola TaxID=1958945 RepID=A0A419RS89_9SPHN|nr:NUDIX domain-containing protein [Aurantiacibacter aquimixticola]RJY08651.1 NUDIX domain-containing protein [Aurantiacibacter aquimixticola]
MEEFPTWQPVVALALTDGKRRWLMHRRPPHKRHGGMWEFPGGKVEAFENPREGLVREVREELDIAVAAEDLQPACFADEGSQVDGKAIVILLYIASKWIGEPRSLEGGKIGWFKVPEIERLERPQLDIDLTVRIFGAPSGH